MSRVPALALSAALAACAHAQPPDEPGNALTLYGGWRDGGALRERDTEAKLRLHGATAFALALDVGLDVRRQLQFFVGHQSTTLDLSGARAPASRLPLRVSTFHLGGTNFFEGPIGRGPYATGGLGVTLLAPGAGYRRELRPSLSLGLGWQQPLAAHLALRVEARAHVVLVHSSGGLFCSGGCVVLIKGDALAQGDAMLGLSARF